MSSSVPTLESPTATNTEAFTPTVTSGTVSATQPTTLTNDSVPNHNSDGADGAAPTTGDATTTADKEERHPSSGNGSTDSSADEMQNKAYQHSHEAQRSRNRRFLCFGVSAVALLVTLGIILGIAFGKEGRASQGSAATPPDNGEGGDEPADSPTAGPASTPTSAPFLVTTTRDPTTAPTVPGAPSVPPVPEPEVTAIPSLRPTIALTTSPTSGIQAMLVSTGVALRGGSEFEEETSPQAQSLAWLESTALRTWPDAKLIRRYVLGCIYFGTQSVITASTIVFYESTGAPPEWLNSTGWTTGEDECSWHGVTCDENGDIARISLPNNRLSGKMPDEITALKDTLIELDLTSNVIENVGESDLAWLGELTKLQYLYVGGNYFGYFGLPPFLGKLTELRELDVSYCSFHGPMNAELIFSNTPNLYYLEMGGNGYNSSIPDVIIDLPELERLYIDNSFLSGDLSWLGSDRVPFLFELWIDDNVGMTATLPGTIGSLDTTFASLSLTNINLGGTLPTEMGLLTNMIQMWLYENDLEGTVPTELTNLANMKIFQIQGNPLLTGAVSVCAANTNPGLEDIGADCDSVGCECCTCCSMEECVRPQESSEGSI